VPPMPPPGHAPQTYPGAPAPHGGYPDPNTWSGAPAGYPAAGGPQPYPAPPGSAHGPAPYGSAPPPPHWPTPQASAPPAGPALDADEREPDWFQSDPSGASNRAFQAARRDGGRSALPFALGFAFACVLALLVWAVTVRRGNTPPAQAAPSTAPKQAPAGATPGARSGADGTTASESAPARGAQLVPPFPAGCWHREGVSCEEEAQRA
jgi:hypothetical protein